MSKTKGTTRCLYHLLLKYAYTEDNRKWKVKAVLCPGMTGDLKGPITSTLPILVHHPAAEAGCGDLCESIARGRLDCSLVLRVGPHTLRQIDIGSLA